MEWRLTSSWNANKENENKNNGGNLQRLGENIPVKEIYVARVKERKEEADQNWPEIGI